MADVSDRKPDPPRPAMMPTPPCEICGGTDGAAPYGVRNPRRWLHPACWEAERQAASVSRKPPKQPSFRFACPRCGMVSYHPRDIAEGYCGNCHDWTGERAA